MTYHLIHCILLNHLGEPIPIPKEKGKTWQQALAEPIVSTSTPYSILDLGCGSGIWAMDMAK